MRIDSQLLDDVGLGALSDEAKSSLLKHLVEQLELNVGTVIASHLSEEQIKQFEKLIDEQNQSEALAWLQANYPGYKQVVQAELEKLKGELKNNAESILAADQPA